MKKGISSPMLAIALGIIFIVIVLLVFGVPLKDYVTKQFEIGPFKAVKPDTTHTTGTSGTGKLELPVNKLSGTPDSVKVTIAKKLVECFSRMRSQNNEKGAERYECEKIEVTSLSDGSSSLPISGVVEVIKTNKDNEMKLTGGLDQSYRDLVVERFRASWKDLYKEDPAEKGTVDVGVVYLLCADLDSGRDTGGWPEDPDDLYMARNLPFNCE
jgi:hypothetical protein